MPQTLLLAGIAAPIMLILDFTWIGFVANSFYRSQLGSLYSPHVVWQAAILFYVIYLLGLAFFVIAPAVQSHNIWKAAGFAAFFALVAYGTYDLTSLSITTGWPVAMTCVDMAWGIVCAIITSTGAYLIATTLLKW